MIGNMLWRLGFSMIDSASCGLIEYDSRIRVHTHQS